MAEPASLAREVSAGDHTEEWTPTTGDDLPAALAEGEERRRGMPCVADRVLPRAQVDLEVHGRGEALDPALSREVVVGGGQELVRGHRPEQAAEGSGQQQRAGAGAGALAADVDEHDLQAITRGRSVGDEEVAGEVLAVGRADARRHLPARGQVWQLAAEGDAVAQLGEHAVAAKASGPDPRARHRRDEHDGHHGDDRDRHEHRAGQPDAGVGHPAGHEDERDAIDHHQGTGAQDHTGDDDRGEEERDRHGVRPPRDGGTQGQQPPDERHEKGALGDRPGAS